MKFVRPSIIPSTGIIPPASAINSGNAKSLMKEENNDEKTVKGPNDMYRAGVSKPLMQPLQDKKKAMNWESTHKILPKFVNKNLKSNYGSALEFSKSAFSLTKVNENGYRESLDAKLLMNFWTFDQSTNKTVNAIPAYIDISEWLNVCHMILSGRIYDKTELARLKQKQGGYQFCNFIYQNCGGSYKPIFKVNNKQFGGDKDNPISTIFKITPAGNAETKDKWTFSAEIRKGVQGPTGLIEPLKNSAVIAKITVLLTYDDLVRIAKMSEMAIQAYMVKL